MKPIRVLHVVGVMNRGGLETFIMNAYRHIDREKIQFDFLVHKKEPGAFDEEIRSLGGKIYKIPYINNVGHFGYINELDKFFGSHKEYKVVHSHMNTMSGLILRAAKKQGIRVRVAHSHSTKYATSLLEKTYKRLVSFGIPYSAMHFFACSYEAGRALYGKKIAKNEMEIIKNGIALDDFSYSKKGKAEIRKEFGIDNKTFVIGHVGRFQKMKNHTRIIDIFNEFHNSKPESILVLVGDGELRVEIEEKVKKLGIEKSVKFLGVRSDVNRVMQIFDSFLFPSLYEGLPVTLIEAQTAGLNCVISANISKEVDMNLGLIKFVDLDQSNTIWASKLMELSTLTCNDVKNSLKENGYDIVETAKRLQSFYIKEYENAN